jgi:D-sedoheptulose 7-phosphate isomerase
VLTAWSNDHSFDDVFARQIEALGSRGDLAFGISTSGTAANVLKALERARGDGPADDRSDRRAGQPDGEPL